MLLTLKLSWWYWLKSSILIKLQKALSFLLLVIYLKVLLLWLHVRMIVLIICRMRVSAGSRRWDQKRYGSWVIEKAMLSLEYMAKSRFLKNEKCMIKSLWLKLYIWTIMLKHNKTKIDKIVKIKKRVLKFVKIKLKSQMII